MYTYRLWDVSFLLKLAKGLKDLLDSVFSGNNYSYILICSWA